MQYFIFSFIYRVNDKSKSFMKKKKWSIKALLSGALALLGFAGCSDCSDDSEFPDYPLLYGSPSVGYRVMGTVTDKEGKPLKDIQVIMDNPSIVTYVDEEGKNIRPKVDTVSMKLIPDTVYTDEKGQFSGLNTVATSLSKLTVEFRDIDGEANGGDFSSQQLAEKDFEKKQAQNADGWFTGKFKLSKNVKLKRKGE